MVDQEALNSTTLKPDLPPKSTARILVVDDERNIRSAVSLVLSGSGFTVFTAADGVEAEAILKTEPIDVILLDVRLPGRTGLELLKEWKSKFAGSCVILMSGEASLTEALDGLKQGAFDFLEKPILTARLLTAIGHAADRVESRKRIDLGQGETVIGESDQIKKAMRNAEIVASTKARVLITGESGTGKDLLARFIHLSSARKNRPFIKINCASMAPDLIESELFGHVKGAFTGAISARRGHFESAHGGTLFLDEIGELPLAAQAKMLRTLQNGEFNPVGSSETRTADVRVLSATNRDLRREVADGNFREDLYYRLAVVSIESPALRDRLADLEGLVSHFLAHFADEYGVPPKSFEPKALTAMKQYPWPGNIRELRNVIERCMILCGDVISVTELPPEISSVLAQSSSQAAASESAATGTMMPWHEFKNTSERQHILRAIELANGNMTEAAKLLQVERQTIYKWIKAYEIEK